MTTGWIGAELFSDDALLPALERKCLAEAAIVLVDLTIECIAQAGTVQDDLLTSLPFIDHLPPKFIGRYDYYFTKEFLVSLIVVSWKLQAPGRHRLACVAEELALHAIVREAEATLDEHGELVEVDYSSFEDHAFEDLDFRLMWDDSRDGIETSEIGAMMGVCNLEFDRWFDAFKDRYTHPFTGDR